MANEVRDMKLRAKAALEHLGASGIRTVARDQGYKSVSQFLEHLDPSDSQERAVGLDAFSRVLMVADVKSSGDRYGSFASDPLEDFKKKNVVGLIDEWVRRVWDSGTSIGLERAATMRAAVQGTRAGAQYFSSDYITGTIQRPFDDDRTLRMQQIVPAIPLAELVTRTRINQGPDYRARYLTEPVDPNQIRLLRVTESSELPRAFLTEGQRTIKLYKYGRQLQATYEALRRLPLEDFATHIRKLALQTEVDQVAALIDVAINGDGNAGTSAPVYNLTTLDSTTTANNLTLAAWLAWRLKWVNPYGVTHVLARAAEMLKVLTLTTGNINTLATSANLASIQQELTPINNRLRDGVRYGITDDAPAARIVGIDSRFGIERVVEAGSEISETERWITSQQEILTFSMNEAYANIDVNAVRILRLDA